MINVGGYLENYVGCTAQPQSEMPNISISESVTRVFTYLSPVTDSNHFSLGGFQLNQNNPITNQVLTSLCEIDSQINTAEWPLIRGTKERKAE